MPNDFPKWRTVYEFYHMWISIGFFDRLTQELNAMARGSQGKSTQPTVAVIDSQSVCTGLTQSVKGVDGGKKIKGIKRHLAVDSNGLSDDQIVKGGQRLSRTFSKKLKRRTECGIGVCEIEFRHIGIQAH